MVQRNQARSCHCTPQARNSHPLCQSSNIPRPLSNSRYSTVNYIPPSSTVNNERYGGFSGSQRVHCQNQHQGNKSYWERSTASSCLVGFMKFIQHQCHPKKKTDVDCNQQVVILHEDVVTAMRQLKCDLERITEMERKNCGNLSLVKGEESPRKILTRMAFKIYEIEDRLMKPNIPTCGELITKRKVLLNLIKTLQKTIGCYLECEVQALKDRQSKLCNLLKCLQCIESEFRCMTKGIKAQCCDKPCAQGKTVAKKSNLSLTLAKKKSLHEKLEPCINNINTKEYEITGVNVVYTKSRIHTLESGNDENNNREITEEESIDRQISCHIPVDGEPICEVKIMNGNETLQLCDSDQLKQKLCEMSNVWVESARQLIEAFHSA